MAVITFWNDGKAETGQSMSVAAIASTLAINYNYKILIIDTKYENKSLEWAFDSGKDVRSQFVKGKTDLETGLGGVAKAIMSNKTSPEIIINYTKIIFRNLELLRECNSTKEDFDRYFSYMGEIIKLANRYYDIVLVDLEGKLESPEIKKILQNSTINVVTLVQNLKVIDNFIEQKSKYQILKENNLLIELNKYDDKSKYSVKNVSKYIREKNVVKIPYNTLFGECAGEGKVADYCIKFRGVNSSNINANFMNSINETADVLIEMAKNQQSKKY